MGRPVRLTRAAKSLTRNFHPFPKPSNQRMTRTFAHQCSRAAAVAEESYGAELTVTFKLRMHAQESSPFLHREASSLIGTAKLPDLMLGQGHLVMPPNSCASMTKANTGGTA